MHLIRNLLFVRNVPSRVLGSAGFTLIETLVAISLLTVAIVAPMSLAGSSLGAAYYARDQITAFHLAQEGIEVIRDVRDQNILQNALGANTDLFAGIPNTAGQPFVVNSLDNSMALCPAPPANGPPDSGCPPLQANSQMYGYRPGCLTTSTSDCGNDATWTDTGFRRSVTATYVGTKQDELRVTVTVTWQTRAFQPRSFSISENLYRWLYVSS